MQFLILVAIIYTYIHNYHGAPLVSSNKKEINKINTEHWNQTIITSYRWIMCNYIVEVREENFNLAPFIHEDSC